MLSSCTIAEAKFNSWLSIVGAYGYDLSWRTSSGDQKYIKNGCPVSTGDGAGIRSTTTLILKLQTSKPILELLSV